MGHRGASLPGTLMIARWRIFEFRQRPYGAPCGRLVGNLGHRRAGQGAIPGASGAIRESRQGPYGASCGRLGGRAVRKRWQPGPCPQASGAIRQSRQRPYGASRRRLGGNPGRKGGGPGPVPGREAQFANLDKDPVERAAVGGRRDWRGCRSASRAGPAARCKSRPRPYGTPSGGVGGGSGSRGGVSRGPAPGRPGKSGGIPDKISCSDKIP
jgi:hypothetical protein